MTKILVIDDEPSITKLVSAYLQPEGYEVHVAADGPSGLKAARAFKPDLVILDVMLPGMDGIELLSRLRRESDVYVILLTARTEETDKIVGLSVGADDYVTKPFSPREVVARVRSALRRIQLDADTLNHEILRYNQLTLDVIRRRVTLADRVLELTPTEFNVLLELMRHPGIPITRFELAQKHPGYDYESLERSIDTHIRNLRKKIEADPRNPIYIQTVYGVGYRLGDE